MKEFKISVMKSHKGIYTGKWVILNNGIKAGSTRAALRGAAPITTRLDESPTLSRPRKGIAVYEYSNVRYAVEAI